MGNHARISPSSMDRILSCPASVNLSADYPDQESEFAREGTEAHEELEKCLLMGTDSDNPHIQVVLDYVKQRQLDGLDIVKAETRVFPKMLGDYDVWGTADIILYDYGLNELEVVDLKYGKGVMVEAEGNRQLQTYLLGAISTLVPKGFEPPSIYRATIIQPRIEHPEGFIRSVDYSTDNLREIADYMRERLALVDAEEPVYGPSGKACRWCKAKADCAHRAGHNLEELGLSFDPIEPATMDDTAKLSTDRVVQILEAADEIRAWLADVEDGVVSRLKAREAIPGFKLVHGRANRKWKLPESETMDKLKSLGFKVKEYTTTKIASPAAIEKVVKARKMKAAKRDAVAELVEKPEGKLTLVPETDSRPAAILPKPEQAFEDLTQSDEPDLANFL